MYLEYQTTPRYRPSNLLAWHTFRCDSTVACFYRNRNRRPPRINTNREPVNVNKNTNSKPTVKTLQNTRGRQVEKISPYEKEIHIAFRIQAPTFPKRKPAKEKDRVRSNGNKPRDMPPGYYNPREFLGLTCPFGQTISSPADLVKVVMYMLLRSNALNIHSIKSRSDDFQSVPKLLQVYIEIENRSSKK